MQNAVPVGKVLHGSSFEHRYNSLEKFILEKKFQTTEISNDNCPGQCVISGEKQEVDEIVILLKKELKKKSIFLLKLAPSL